MTSPDISPQAITAEAVDDVATAIATTPPYRNPVMVTDRHRAEARRALEAAKPHLAAFPRCPTPCDSDCEQPCHEVHQPAWKRDHNPEACVAAIVAEAVAAERARLYAELGNDHHVIFAEDGWTVEHSVECRLSGQMHRCEYHTAIARVADEYEMAMAGRWKITSIDSEGMPGFERAEKQP